MRDDNLPFDNTEAVHLDAGLYMLNEKVAYDRIVITDERSPQWSVSAIIGIPT